VYKVFRDIIQFVSRFPRSFTNKKFKIRTSLKNLFKARIFQSKKKKILFFAIFYFLSIS